MSSGVKSGTAANDEPRSARSPTDRGALHGALLYPVLLCALAAVVAAGLLGGAGGLGYPALTRPLLSLRATRSVAALLAGAALATGGVIVQGLFRNPLAEPSILGATAGASLGGRTTMLLFQALASGALARAI